MSLLVDIHKNLGDFQLDVSFEADEKVVGLLGASGSGKSLTLRCIAGVETPDRGRIVLDGVTLFDSEKRVNLPPQKRQIGYMFQSYSLFPNMTVQQNILCGMRRVGKKERPALLRRIMENMQLTGLEAHYPHQLSGGQQQRVALARILASEPGLIMLDEPLSALDSYLRWQLETELVRLLERFEGTTLYVSHNRSEVYRICRRVCVMHQGLSEPVCDVAALFERPGTLAAALLSGCKNYSRTERIDTHTVLAMDWGIPLTCGTAVPEDARYIGVRAHYFSLCDGPGENAFVCAVQRVAEDVFETILTVRPKTAEPGRTTANIRIERPKEAVRGIREGDEVWVAVRPKDVMPLRH